MVTAKREEKNGGAERGKAVQNCKVRGSRHGSFPGERRWALVWEGRELFGVGGRCWLPALLGWGGGEEVGAGVWKFRPSVRREGWVFGRGGGVAFDGSRDHPSALGVRWPAAGVEKAAPILSARCPRLPRCTQYEPGAVSGRWRRGSATTTGRPGPSAPLPSLKPSCNQHGRRLPRKRLIVITHASPSAISSRRV